MAVKYARFLLQEKDRDIAFKVLDDASLIDSFAYSLHFLRSFVFRKRTSALIDILSRRVKRTRDDKLCETFVTRVYQVAVIKIGTNARAVKRVNKLPEESEMNITPFAFFNIYIYPLFMYRNSVIRRKFIEMHLCIFSVTFKIISLRVFLRL